MHGKLNAPYESFLVRSTVSHPFLEYRRLREHKFVRRPENWISFDVDLSRGAQDIEKCLVIVALHTDSEFGPFYAVPDVNVALA